jgi:hypothetical protein
MGSVIEASWPRSWPSQSLANPPLMAGGDHNSEPWSSEELIVRRVPCPSSMGPSNRFTAVAIKQIRAKNPIAAGARCDNAQSDDPLRAAKCLLKQLKLRRLSSSRPKIRHDRFCDEASGDVGSLPRLKFAPYSTKTMAVTEAESPSSDSSTLDRSIFDSPNDREKIDGIARILMRT